MISESEFTVKAHGVHTAYIEMTKALKKRNDVDVEINVARENADIMHVQTIGLFSLAKMRKTKAKIVISGHIIPASLVGSIKGMQHLSWLTRWYMRYVYNKADLVLAVSNMVREEMIGPMKIKPKVEVMYNTVNMANYVPKPGDKAKARQKLNFNSDEFIVIGNGQVQPRKRLDTFFEAAEKLPDTKFIWVGGVTFKQLGAEYEKMQKMMNNKPDNVLITGVIDHSEVMAYLHAADAFFLPAEQENHPMCVLEAAGAGLPIILRDIHEYDDTFRPDAQFIQTTEDAINAVEKLRNDPEFYKRQQLAAANIANRFDSLAGGEKLVNFYKSLL